MSAKRSSIIEQEGEEDALMEYSLTEGVDVLPSFDAMGLKEDLLRGIYAYGTHMIAINTSIDTYICLCSILSSIMLIFVLYMSSTYRIRAPFRHPAESHQANHHRSGRDRTVTVRDRQDSRVLHRHSAGDRQRLQ